MLIEGENSSLLMNADFLKHKFNQEAKLSALNKLIKEGVNGISNYHQTFILTSSRDKLVRLFLVQTGELLYTFVGHDNWVRGLALHPTGKYLYTASDDKTLRVWDLTYGKEKKKIDAHEHFISTVRFHPKYGVIATAGNDMVVKIWNLK